MEALLGEDPPNAKEAWRRMKGWNQAAAQRGLPPARYTLERLTAVRTEKYSQVPSPGENIPVTVEPAIIDDSVPTEDKIAAAVKKLRRNRSGGAVADPHRAHQGVDRGGQEGEGCGGEGEREDSGGGGGRITVGKSGVNYTDVLQVR